MSAFLGQAQIEQPLAGEVVLGGRDGDAGDTCAPTSFAANSAKPPQPQPISRTLLAGLTGRGSAPGRRTWRAGASASGLAGLVIQRRGIGHARSPASGNRRLLPKVVVGVNVLLASPARSVAIEQVKEGIASPASAILPDDQRRAGLSKFSEKASSTVERSGVSHSPAMKPSAKPIVARGQGAAHEVDSRGSGSPWRRARASAPSNGRTALPESAG